MERVLNFIRAIHSAKVGGGIESVNAISHKIRRGRGYEVELSFLTKQRLDDDLDGNSRKLKEVCESLNIRPVYSSRSKTTAFSANNSAELKVGDMGLRWSSIGGQFRLMLDGRISANYSDMVNFEKGLNKSGLHIS